MHRKEAGIKQWFAPKRFLGNMAEEAGSRAGEAATKKVVEGLKQPIQDLGNSTSSKIRTILRNASVSATLGGLAGAATSPKGDKAEGATRGVAGGLLGGMVGSGLVPRNIPISGKFLIPGAVGSVLGGSLGGYTTKNRNSDKKKESSMEGYKFAGVTLDYYDDLGATLKQKFPTKESLPDTIKQADIRPKEKLANEDFALVMVDRGHVYRKYACYDPGTTAMSTVYFMEHGNKLPEDAKKLAASNLVDACVRHDLMPPAAMTKAAGVSPDEDLTDSRIDEMHAAMRGGLGGGAIGGLLKGRRGILPGAMIGAGGMAAYYSARDLLDPKTKKTTIFHKRANEVSVTGQRPKPVIKLAAPTSDEDYAVVMPDGSRYYPINSWDRVKTAEAYWLDEKIRMAPDVRRQFAVKLAQKSFILGYPLDEDITDAGARSYQNPGHLKYALEMRKVACSPMDDSRKFLDDLFEKRAELNPETYAECLRRFDVNNGLDKGWDNLVLDPWASTFGVDKTASMRVVWEEGAERVTEDALVNLVNNNLKNCKEIFTDAMCTEFQKDPVGIFESLPAPQKKILARLASDSEAKGNSEAGTVV